MSIWSISFSYRLGLGFHALNNEGSEGSNLMQPRRIDVGKFTYDGISGEMVRRHILENFVNVCRAEKISLLPVSEALHPDRGQLGIRKVANELGSKKLTKQNPAELYRAVRKAVESCAVLDVGGFLAPFGDSKSAEEGDGDTQPSSSTGKSERKAAPVAVAPEDNIEKGLVGIGSKKERPYTVKRDSVFDVGWLISEKPQDLVITQHAAYRPSGDQSLFSQTMRSNVYAGVIRADLHRIGTDDYWYLQPGANGQGNVSRFAVDPGKQRQRQRALIKAIVNFIASPTGAKVAGWAPHVFLTEGAILLTSGRTAPFVSPIKVEVGDENAPIKHDNGYIKAMKDIENNTDTWCWSFTDAKTLLDKLGEITTRLNGGGDGQKQVKAG